MSPLFLELNNPENTPNISGIIPQSIEEFEESKQIQLGASNHEQSEGTVVKKDNRQTDETEVAAGAGFQRQPCAVSADR